MLTGIPIGKKTMQSDEKLIFLGGNISSLNIWTKVVQPTQSTTFRTSFETCKNKFLHLNLDILVSNLFMKENFLLKTYNMLPRVMYGIFTKSNHVYNCALIYFFTYWSTNTHYSFLHIRSKDSPALLGRDLHPPSL